MRVLETGLRKARWFAATRRTATVAPDAGARGRALLSYIVDPFLLPEGEALPTSHTNFWESLAIARILVDLGFACDVVSYHNTTFRFRRDYDIVIDVRHNLERLAPRLRPDCLKLAHLDTASLRFQAAAEQQRLDDLRQRRGVTLQRRRYERPNRAVDVADAATVIGNDWTLSTYAATATPLHKVPVTSTVSWETLPQRDWDAARRSFLWFGSGGMVHKGLDLVLEVFAARPDISLVVCGPVAGEPDFEAAYRTELYDTPNIHTLGWVDVTSTAFEEVIRSCGALVYPSCSEGSSGAVVTAMHGGVIPIVTRESGVDVDADEGIVLRDSRPADIEAAIDGLSQRPLVELQDMAHAAWQAAHRRHSRSAFMDRYRAVLELLIDEGNSS